MGKPKKPLRETVQALDAGASFAQKLVQAVDWVLQQAVGTQPGAIVTVSIVIAGMIWAWLKETPWWVAMPAIFVTLGGSTAGIYYFRKLRDLPKRVANRELLANDLEKMSRKIAALVGEYKGPLQESWWKESGNRERITASHEARAVIEGRLVQRYSDLYATDAWLLIRRTQKVIYVELGRMYHMQHHVTGEMDITGMYVFLAQLADDVRVPAPLIVDPPTAPSRPE